MSGAFSLIFNLTYSLFIKKRIRKRKINLLFVGFFVSGMMVQFIYSLNFSNFIVNVKSKKKNQP